MLLLRVQLASLPDIDVVGTAVDGIEALERVKDLHPDAVVMDLLMPRMGGLEAIEELRKDAPDVGVVAYSAVASENVREEAKRLGVPLLLKSGEPGPLVQALHDVADREGRNSSDGL